MSTIKTELDQATKAQRLPNRIERKLKFSHLTEKQKNILIASGVGVAGVSMGVIAMSLMGVTEASEKEVNPPIIPGDGNECVEIIIYTDAPFVTGITDSMSFTNAFQTARQEVGAGGVFEWRGNLYNTYLKEEWEVMSSEQKADFFSSLDKNFLPGDEMKEKEILDIVNDNSSSFNLDDLEDIVIIEDDETINPIDPDEEMELVIIEPEDGSFYESGSEDVEIKFDYESPDDIIIVSDDV